MKKIVLALGISACLFLAGCSSDQIADRGNVPSAMAGAPAWVFQPAVDGKLAASGSAPKSMGGFQFQRTEALSAARDELGRMLTVKVRNIFKKYQEATGVGEDQTFDKVTQDTSKQVAKVTLAGSRQVDLWVAGDGSMHVLVALDTAAVAQAIKEAARTSLGNTQALYQKEEAKAAFETLDEEIDKAFN